MRQCFCERLPLYVGHPALNLIVFACAQLFLFPTAGNTAVTLAFVSSSFSVIGVCVRLRVCIVAVQKVKFPWHVSVITV